MKPSTILAWMNRHIEHVLALGTILVSLGGLVAVAVTTGEYSPQFNAHPIETVVGMYLLTLTGAIFLGLFIGALVVFSRLVNNEGRVGS